MLSWYLYDDAYLKNIFFEYHELYKMFQAVVMFCNYWFIYYTDNIIFRKQNKNID